MAGSYYVPEQSRLPIAATIASSIMMIGAGIWVVDNGQGNVYSIGPAIFASGMIAVLAVMWVWFTTVIKEHQAGMNSAQLQRSYVWGMGWFIFSEVMFFAAFFGALFYVRNFSIPWLGGEGEKGLANMLWTGFEATWPVMQTPSQALEAATGVVKANTMSGPNEIIPWSGLPLLNTVLLLTSSVTVHFAHTALKAGNDKGMTRWLAATIILGFVFVFFQAEEYVIAYTELGLTLQSGVYGATFFMLTGFHGLHVCIGAIMLTIMLVRHRRGHFKPKDHFGFEAASWYWHFVDVVWVGLFLFVYIL